MGLVTWIAIGVIILVAVGLGAGVFFSGLLRGAQIVSQNPVVQNATQEAAKAAEKTDITSANTVTVVQSEKTVYKTSEPVVIVIKNNGNERIELPSSSAVLKVKNENSGKTYDVIITQTKAELDPGESVTITWDQHDASGATVESGTYSADVQTSSNTEIGKTTFTIQS